MATAIEMSNDEPIGAGDIVIPVAKAAAVASVRIARFPQAMSNPTPEMEIKSL